MNEVIHYSRSNPLNPSLPFWQQMVFYPSAFASYNDAIADLSNLHVTVFLHGAGERGTNIEQLRSTELPRLLDNSNFDRPIDIFCCPQLSTGEWQFDNIQRVYDMLVTEYPGAKSYNVTGLSWGGIGAYNMIGMFPMFFRTCGVLCGGLDNDFVPLPNNGTAAIRAWHSTDDGTLSYSTGLAAITTIQNSGYLNDCEMITLTGLGHAIWDNVYDTSNLYFPWIDSERKEDALEVIRNGVTFNHSEVLEWRNRIVNGPYKVYEDATNFSNGTGNYSPAAGDQLLTKANMFLNDDPDVDEFWDGDFTTSSYSTTRGHYIVAAGYYYTLTGDSAYGYKVKDAILLQANHNNPDFSGSDWNTYPLPNQYFFFAHFVTRLMLAYDYTKDLWNQAEKDQFFDWLDTQKPIWIADQEYYPLTQFPQRNADKYPVDIKGNIADYDSNLEYFIGDQVVNPSTEFEVWESLIDNNQGNALTEGANWTQITASYMASSELWNPVTAPENDEYAYTNQAGVGINRLYRGSLRWFNAMALESLWLIVYLSLKNDTQGLTRAARWYKECITYSHYNDGSTAEWYRNYDSRPAQGTYGYSNMVLETHAITVDILARRKDKSLLNFTTTKGLYGTEVLSGGNPKSLEQHLEDFKDWLTGDRLGWHKTVTDYNALTTQWDEGTANPWRWKVELPYAILNRFYKRSDFKDTYLINNGAYDFSEWMGGIPRYLTKDWGWWTGASGVLAASYMQYAEMEDVIAEKKFIPEFSVTKGYLDPVADIYQLAPTTTYPSIIHANDKVFVSFADEIRRQKIAVFDEITKIKTEYFIDSNPDWTCRNDGHHKSSIGIDRDGYLHIATDMHNYPNVTTDAILPDRYKSKTIMYFRSNSPYNASSWTFYGGSASTSIDGRSFNNVKFVNDNNGLLYAVYRLEVHASYRQGVRGLGIAKYDETTQNWTELGAIPAPYSNDYGSFVPDKKCVIWANGGNQGNAAYQTFYSTVYFDSQNRMHLAAELCAVKYDSGIYYDTVLYTYSDDGGTTWKKANGNALTLPVTPHTGSSQGDLIVSAEPLPGITAQTAKVATDDNDRPIVIYHKVNDQAYLRAWNGTSWGDPTTPVSNYTPTPTPYRVGEKILFANNFSWGSVFRMTENGSSLDDQLIVNDLGLTAIEQSYATNTGKLYGVNVLSETYDDYGYLYYDMPIADAGEDQSTESTSINLDGSNSSRPNGTIASYQWTQLSGPSTCNILTPTLAQTDVEGLINTGAYVFELTVTDTEGYINRDTVTITEVTPSARKTLLNSEIITLRQRWLNNYNSPIPGLPNQITAVEAKALNFISDPESEFVTDIQNIQQINIGNNLVGAAYKYLMDGTLMDNSHPANLHNFILSQIEEPGVDYSLLLELGTGSDNESFSSWWVCKFYLAYDYCRDLFTDTEKSQINAWFFKVGVWMLRSINERQLYRIPYRNSYNEYDTIALMVADQGNHISGRYYYVAETNKNYEFNGIFGGSINNYYVRTQAQRGYGTFTGSWNDPNDTTGLFTHVDSNGVPQNEIKTMHGSHKNVNANMARALLYAGIELDDELMIDHAKLYFEEFLKYATFPDGMTGESRRNGEYGTPPYGYPAQGSLSYQGIITEAFIETGWLSYIHGYGGENLLNLTTSEGRYGTEGGSKNLRLILETEIENMAEEVDRYFSEVNINAKIDCYENVTGRRFTYEQRLARANKFFKEQRIKDCYMLNLDNQIGYDVGSIIGQNPFGGSAGFSASDPLMYELEESINEPDQPVIDADSFGIKTLMI